jgi:hypothetical protein
LKVDILCNLHEIFVKSSFLLDDVQFRTRKLGCPEQSYVSICEVYIHASAIPTAIPTAISTALGYFIPNDSGPEFLEFSEGKPCKGT